MATKTKQITSWSFSRYNTYRQCPRRARFAYLDKIPEEKNEAMLRGARIDKAGEDYIKGAVARLDSQLVSFAKDFKAARSAFSRIEKLAVKGMAPVVQDTWAFRGDWSRTTWNDWDGCALRIKVDLALWSTQDRLDITDWKTGKLRREKNDEYLEQLELYALGALLWFPHAQTVSTRLAYTDLGVQFPTTPTVYTQDDVPTLRKAWEKRTRPMLNDKKFAPRPGDACFWCPFSKKKGGPCQF